MTKHSEIPAFPHSEEYYTRVGTKTQRRYGGMTLRDYFAGQALSNMELGFAPPLSGWKGSWDEFEEANYKEGLEHRVRVMAEYSYKIADAMLAERERVSNDNR